MARMKKVRLKAPAKFLLVFLAVGGLFAALYFGGVIGGEPDGDQVANSGDSEGFFSFLGGGSDDDVLDVTLVTWNGFAGGPYFNRGFEPNPESRFTQEYGTDVRFHLQDDFVTSRNAWYSGEIDAIWGTADTLPLEVEEWMKHDPVILFLSDKSRGGDQLIATRRFETINELCENNAKIAFAEYTPQQTLLLLALESAGCDWDDITPVPVAEYPESSKMMKSGNVDAAIITAPDDKEVLDKVSGSHKLFSTESATEAIPNVFVVKREYLEENPDKVRGFVEGWLRGNAEINSSDEARQEAARILADGFNTDTDFTYDGIALARLATLGDNLEWFGIDRDYDGMTGEDIYDRMHSAYNRLGLAPDDVPVWRRIVDTSVLESLDIQDSADQVAEGQREFSAPTEETRDAQSFASKKVTINFPTGSANLSTDAKWKIDSEFIEIARTFEGARIRIEGNTDNTGSAALNRDLSEQRAEAVKNYLVSEHDIASNRIVTVGNGPDEPVASNDSESGRAQNRRTDFELINN